MKKLTAEEMKQVVGGRVHLSNNTKACINGQLGGMLTGSVGGIGGIILGGIAGAIAGGCFN
ncbi:Blp family class II bacteriocin [Enterococcus hirae]|uniref:Blp family class II bacteriocin n=1 Tax=Enterococcus hirae TaxID=1354 RepID=UPI001A965DD3|nr:Blp family class II bacteriocin [Enterococcus hirae]MBO1102231.1 bacteriocin [Enterococcus hirae]